MCRGDHRKLAAWHVAADRPHRYIFVPENHARKGLNLNIAHRVLLSLGKIANLGLSELDIVHVPGGDLVHQRRDLAVRQPEARRRVAVEFPRKFPNRSITAIFDVR
jgi:hypothetical protein